MTKTYVEMKDQYKALRKTFDYVLSRKNEIIGFFKKVSPKSLTYIGAGSGYCLCKSGELAARVRLGIPATSLSAGDLLLNYGSYEKLLAGTMVIAPSRSGSTSEVVKAIENVKSVAKVSVLAISAVKGSLLSKIADFVLEMPWAYDDSVCQTRTVTNLYTANLLILAYLSGDEKLAADIETAIKLGDRFIDTYEGKLKDVVPGNWSNAVILADGEMQGIADEGAMAFCEIAQIHAHYYHLLDIRHGPMVLVDKDTLVIADLHSNGLDYQKALIADIINRGAKVITYSDNINEVIDGVALHVTSGTSLDNAVHGIPFIFLIQMAALVKAENKGLNPDNPDGLVAWVKL